MEHIFENIEKEIISTLKFPSNEVLNEIHEINDRNHNLQRALALGNLEHSKIKIYFEDTISKKMVETTIWGITDKSIILKKGIEIPIHRIYKII